MSGTRHLAYRRYARTMAIVSTVYAISIVVAAVLIPDRAPPSLMAVLLALVPGLAVLGMILAIVRLFMQLDDEYLRMIEVRKALIATACILAVCSVWGLLEMFTTVPPLPVFWVFPGWCAGLLVGHLVNRFTLGDGGDCP